MAGEAAGLYLDLMKKCLAFTLWEEPYIPVEAVMMNYRFHRRTLLRAFTRVLRSFHLRAVQDADYDQSRRAEGRMWPAYADTMIRLARLDNIQFCVESALRDNVAGDLLEAGVWRGGGTILMRAVLAAHQVRDRRVWVADSFQGLPKPDAMASPADAGDRHHRFEYLAVSREQVAANFRR